MSKSPNTDVEKSSGDMGRAPREGDGRGPSLEGEKEEPMGENAQKAPRKKFSRYWTFREIEKVWQHPDWSAAEIADTVLEGRSAKAVERIRERYGRYSPTHAPLCVKCGERPIWIESLKARRYGLCKECYLTEERLRMQDEKRSAAIRQMRHRRKEAGGK